LEAIDWENTQNLASGQEAGPNAYLESLLKEVGTLHRVLGRYLAPSTLQVILSQVVLSIHGALHEVFSRVEVESTQAKERVLRDAQYFSTKLVELKASEDCQASAKSLEELVRNRFFAAAETTSANGTDIKSPDAKDFPLPPSPLAERTSNFRAKFRFLSPRGTAPDSSASLLAEVTKAATSSPAEEDTSPAALSPGASVAGTEVNVEVEKPTDKSDINQDDNCQQVSTELKPEESAEPVSSDPTPALEVSPSLQNEESSIPIASPDPAVVPSTPLNIPPIKIPLSQRLAALASSRRGSQTSPGPTSEVGPVNTPPIDEKEESQTMPVPPKEEEEAGERDAEGLPADQDTESSIPLTPNSKSDEHPVQAPVPPQDPPVPEAPPKIPLSQRLAALASNRRTGQPSP